MFKEDLLEIQVYRLKCNCPVLAELGSHTAVYLDYYTLTI